jgi:hypothetical protein
MKAGKLIFILLLALSVPHLGNGILHYSGNGQRPNKLIKSEMESLATRFYGYIHDM